MNRRRAGFTLLELMIVVVIIGILASVMIVKLWRARESAYVAAMKSDLRNLLGAEMVYFSDSSSFSSTAPTLFITSTGVTGPTITVSGTNISAWVGSTQSTKTCAIYMGSIPLAPATHEGEPQCQ